MAILSTLLKTSVKRKLYKSNQRKETEYRERNKSNIFPCAETTQDQKKKKSGEINSKNLFPADLNCKEDRVYIPLQVEVQDIISDGTLDIHK